jgi:hypothetical protein
MNDGRSGSGLGRRWRRAGVAVAAGALATGVGACGGSSGGGGASSTAAHSSTAPAAATSSSATTGSAGSAGGSSTRLTAPGTKLTAGQTATVAYDTTLNNGQNGPSNTLRITITAITAGSMADFKGVSLSGVPKGASPTYVTLTMTNLGPKAMNTSDNDPADSIQAIESGGQMDGSVILTGYFPKCNDVDTPNPFPVGKSFTTCETFMERGEATQIGYNGSNATLDSPVIWSP